MKRGKNFWCYIVAFLTVAIWGTTFVWTKLLINNGISPAQIFTLRFIIAYVLMLFFSLVWQKHTPHKWVADSWKDELLMVALGITGGSIYFLAENEALRFTTATNTSLIVCSCPLLTMLFNRLCYRNEHLGAMQVTGSVIACIGMAIVVGIYCLSVLGSLFLADETGSTTVFIGLYHPKSVFLWCTDHHSLLPDCSRISSNGNSVTPLHHHQPALFRMCSLYALLSHMELVYP